MCDMTHSYVRHDSFKCMCMTWLIHMCDMNPLHTSMPEETAAYFFLYFLHIIHTCDMSNSYV